MTADKQDRTYLFRCAKCGAEALLQTGKSAERTRSHELPCPECDGVMRPVLTQQTVKAN